MSRIVLYFKGLFTWRAEDPSTRKILEVRIILAPRFLYSVYMQRVVLVPSAGIFLAERKADPILGGKPDKNSGGSFSG